MTTIYKHRVLPTEAKALHADLARIADAVKDPANLTDGAQGPAVEALQRALRGIGVYSGPINGTYDAATKAAVTSLETAKGMTADGAFDPADLSAVRAQQMFVKSGFDPAARQGQKGTDIKGVEAKMDHLGLSTGTVDGAFDAKTLAALKAYRLQDKSLADKGSTITAGVSKAMTRSLKEVELNLKLLGRDPGAADGKFTAKTARALRAFQRKNKLPVTGEANARTRALLDKKAATAGRFPSVSKAHFQKGYDTSHYQSAAKFNELLRRKSTRFMAIKATDGSHYVDPTFRSRWKQLGKKLKPGKFDARIAYHFLEPGNGRAQANHFLKTLGIHGKLKPGTKLALDWEASALSSPSTLRDAARRIHQVTGEWPLIYTSASRVPQAHRIVPKSPIWDAHWSPTNADYRHPFVQTGIKDGADQDVFSGSELALRKWAGWF